MFYASDLISQYYPWYQLVAQYLRHGQLPHWVPALYGTGYPLLAEGETGVLSPINAFILAILPFPLSINILYVIYAVMGFTGMWYFLKSLNLSPISRFIGAVTFIFSGFIITRYFQPAIIFTSLLFPWGMYAIHARKLFWLPIIIYLQFTAGHAQMTLISLIGYFLYFAFLNFQFVLSFRVLEFLRFLAIIILGLGLSAIQIFPSIQLFKASDRRNWNPMIRFSYSLPPSHLITYLNPYAFGISQPGDDAGFHQIGGGFWELNLTIWTLPFLLSLIPIFYRRSNPFTLYLVWIIFLFLSFGGYTPIYRLLTKLPHFPFRAPSRFLLVATFSATALAAKGFHELTKNIPTITKLSIIVLVLGISLWQLTSLKNYFVLASPQIITHLPSTVPLPLDPNNPVESRAFIIAFNQGLLITLLNAGILLWLKKRWSWQ